jgi:hypothetical protein
MTQTLIDELMVFKFKVDPKTAHESYSVWRERDHDDLVLATAMACWFREFWNRRIDQSNTKRHASLGGREAVSRVIGGLVD